MFASDIVDSIERCFFPFLDISTLARSAISTKQPNIRNVIWPQIRSSVVEHRIEVWISDEVDPVRDAVAAGRVIPVVAGDRVVISCLVPLIEARQKILRQLIAEEIVGVVKP